MATVYDRKNDDGSHSLVATVRVTGFNSSSKVFCETDYPNRREAKKAAAAWAADLEKTLREQRVRKAVHRDLGGMKFAELVESYIADPETKALSTYDERERQMGWWVERYGSTRALEFPSPVLLREAREKLQALHSAATVNRYLAAARACVNFGRAAGLLPPNLVWPPKLMLTEPKHRERFLSDEELVRVKKAAQAHSTLMHAAVMFAIGVGCRQSEQLRVRWRDVDEKGSTVAISVTKTETSRRAHLPPAVVDALKSLKGGKVHPLPARYVFADAEGKPIKAHIVIDAWEKIREAAGVADVRWHDLRHTSASYLIQNGATLAEVAGQLGHRNTATSARYAHLIPGAKPTGADKLDEKLRNSG